MSTISKFLPRAARANPVVKVHTFKEKSRAQKLFAQLSFFSIVLLFLLVTCKRFLMNDFSNKEAGICLESKTPADLTYCYCFGRRTDDEL